MFSETRWLHCSLRWTHSCTHNHPVPIAAISPFFPPPPPLSFLHPFNRMYRVRGSGLETTKDTIRQCSLVLVPNPPSYPLVPPTFFSLPLFFLKRSSFSLLTFHLLLSIRPPPPAPFLLSYRRRTIWFWAQMALACLWRWIKPASVSFPLHVQVVRTKNVKQDEWRKECEGGRGGGGKKKDQDCETTPDANVSRHSWKSKLKRL